MYELMLLAQVTFDGPYIPGKVTAEVIGYESTWLTHTRTNSQCQRQARDTGYRKYIWSPSLQPAGGRLHLTGECLGIDKRKSEALEYELNQGEHNDRR